MRLFGSTKKDVDKDKDDENVPKLESIVVVLIRCNLVKNDYQHTSRAIQQINFTGKTSAGAMIYYILQRNNFTVL